MSNAVENALTHKVALISLDIGNFGGYRRATKELIESLGGRLPDSQAVTEGSIKVFPNGPLKPFQTRRRNLFREIGKMGIKAMGSGSVFAIPRTKMAKAEQLIADADAEYKADLVAFDKSFEDDFEAHVKANPEAESILRSLKISKAYAMLRFRFNHDIFTIAPVLREGEDPEKGVQSIVAGLARQLYVEVADTMADLLENDSLNGKGRAGQRTLRPIKAQVEKMEGLTFLSDTVDDVIAFIGAVLSTFPKDGWIEDWPGNKAFTRLKRFLEKFSEADGIVDAAGRARRGRTVDEILFPELQKAAPAVAALTTAPVAITPVAVAPVVIPVAATAAPAVVPEPVPVVAPQLSAEPVSVVPTVAAPKAPAKARTKAKAKVEAKVDAKVEAQPAVTPDVAPAAPAVMEPKPVVIPIPVARGSMAVRRPAPGFRPGMM